VKFKEKMSWVEFKFLIKKLRGEADRLTKEAGTQIWCEFQFPIPSNRDNAMMINPYSVNLKTGLYWGRDLASGEYRTVNLKEELKEDEADIE